MKTIIIDDELYAFIASKTEHIGESASEILRRILIKDHGLKAGSAKSVDVTEPTDVTGAVTEINKTKKKVSLEPQVIHSSVVNAAGVFNVLSDEVLKTDMSKVNRFLLILGALHGAHSEQFSKILEIKGKGRLYFAQDKQALLSSGSSTNPKQIPDSYYWVVTNNNTAKKSSMLTEVAKKLGYSDNNIKKLSQLFTPS